MELTWFGWVYLALVALSISIAVLKAGQPRGPHLEGDALLFSIVFTLAVAAGIFFIGVTQ